MDDQEQKFLTFMNKYKNKTGIIFWGQLGTNILRKDVENFVLEQF